MPGKTLGINKTKSVLFFRNADKIINIMVLTLLFREIKKYFDVKLYILCGGNNKEIIRYNNNVSRIIQNWKSFFE
jgi:ADP-heptose:LPS heptosyltransferase